ncbi:hypothetical protein HHK36_001204 [Tetracentron sinense]|uniref:Uncharacterized protein n=1 Tax=Tetracentron sinense TaxID=13715 RepID=A0A834ZXQ3_TETSI|nr:hypothetical protein HHK36_001204 [Tetracentron sinense]
METLSSLALPPLYITKASPLRRRSPTLHPTTMNKPSSPTRTWELHAEAKGFGRPAVSKKRKQNDEDITNTTSGRDGDDEDDDKIPSVVFDRMIARILFYVGVPMITGVALLQLFSILKDQHVWDVPLWLPFLTTLIAFGSSALGIAYGTLSTSLDPDKEGSVLGWEEAQQNWPELWKEENERER